MRWRPTGVGAMAAVAVVVLTALACKRGAEEQATQDGAEAVQATAGGEGENEAAKGSDTNASEPGETPDREAAQASSSSTPASSDRPPAGSGPSPAVRRASDPPALSGTDAGDDPVAPPERAPDNPFGYDRPVRGCFEGRVYALESNRKRLPRSYEALDDKGRIYACEFNVWTRNWKDEGLPGFDGRHELFAIRYTGAFRVNRSGLYEFRLRSDDGSRLRIDGEVVVNNDGAHSAHSETGEVELEAGDHTLELEYFQGRHHVNLQLWVTPPDGEEGLLSVRAP